MVQTELQAAYSTNEENRGQFAYLLELLLCEVIHLLFHHTTGLALLARLTILLLLLLLLLLALRRLLLLLLLWRPLLLLLLGLSLQQLGLKVLQPHTHITQRATEWFQQSLDVQNPTAHHESDVRDPHSHSAGGGVNRQQLCTQLCHRPY
jgi:hypothetical protein